jgi:hypothetical protein
LAFACWSGWSRTITKPKKIAETGWLKPNS